MRLSQIIEALAAAAISILAGCAPCGYAQNCVVAYNRRALLAYLHSYGYGENSINRSWQNASGTKLYFEELVGQSRFVWVLQADRPDPLRIEFPPGGAWIDNAERVRPLPGFVNLSDIPAGTVNVGVDLESGYFFVAGGGGVRVGKIDRPDGWLFQCPADTANQFNPAQICAVGDALVLVDHHRRMRPEPRDNCWVLRPDATAPGGWRRQVRWLGGEIDCADPMHDRLLCSAYGGMPMPRRLFFYDVASGGTRNLGIELRDVLVFIVPSDFVGPRLRRAG